MVIPDKRRGVAFRLASPSSVSSALPELTPEPPGSPMAEFDVKQETQAPALEVEGQLHAFGVSQAPPHKMSQDFDRAGSLNEPMRTSTPPPPSSPLSAPASPAVHDFTANIAAMKVKALAASLSSEEDRPRGEVPRELSPDSSDEQDIFATAPKPRPSTTVGCIKPKR